MFSLTSKPVFPIHLILFALACLLPGCGGGGDNTLASQPQSPGVGNDTWAALPSILPTARHRATSSVLNGAVYVIGGSTTSALGYSGAIERYNPSSTQFPWSTRSPMPTARIAPCSATVGDNIYVIGGLTAAGATDVVESYNANSGWADPLTPMPTARFDSACVAVNGLIYVIGGTGDASQHVATVEVYDPANNTWIIGKSAMPSPRGSFFAALVGDAIYAIGGYDGTNYLSTAEKYDVANDAWSTVAAMPTARGTRLTGGVIGQRIYAVGGKNAGNEALNTVEEYDPATDQWTTMTPMPTARTAATASVLEDTLFVFGGLAADNTVLNVVEYYQ
jgi:N-acetylneuraminic acid mutarotase